jgi:galactokinase
MSRSNGDPQAVAPALKQLVDEVRQAFGARYNRPPTWMVAAPGRVNVIGEHTDYNGGYVLPMAIDRYVAIAAGPLADRQDHAAQVFSVDMDETDTIQLRAPIEPGPVRWSSYVQGVVAGLAERGWNPEGFGAVIQSTVPVGGGLSSSAALEVATATLLEAVCGQKLDPVDKALLCQHAEHTFAGVPCGIMDQFSSVLCRADTLMLLDCRSQEAQLVPFGEEGISVIIANTNVKHELTGGEYAQRRRECESTAKTLGVATLRDATMNDLLAAKDRIDDVCFRRARHVISEIERTVVAADGIRNGNWPAVGDLMYASHDSLKDDYEVSCDELDLMVDLARSLGAEQGIIGSRMTGGGFGGCTVSLVRTDAAPGVMETLHQQYKQQTGIEPSIFATRPSQGAMVLEG